MYYLFGKKKIINATSYRFSETAWSRIKEWAVGPKVIVYESDLRQHEFYVATPDDKVLFKLDLEGQYIAA